MWEGGGWFGGASRGGCGRGEDAWVEEAFVLEVGACRDEELGELARRVGAGVDGRREARPEGGAGVGEGGEGAGGGAGEGVVDGGGEARPEVGRFLKGGVAQGWRRREGEDGDEVRFGVGWEVEVRD